MKRACALLVLAALTYSRGAAVQVSIDSEVEAATAPCLQSCFSGASCVGSGKCEVCTPGPKPSSFWCTSCGRVCCNAEDCPNSNCNYCNPKTGTCTVRQCGSKCANNFECRTNPENSCTDCVSGQCTSAQPVPRPQFNPFPIPKMHPFPHIMPKPIAPPPPQPHFHPQPFPHSSPEPFPQSAPEPFSGNPTPFPRGQPFPHTMPKPFPRSVPQPFPHLHPQPIPRPPVPVPQPVPEAPPPTAPVPPIPCQTPTGCEKYGPPSLICCCTNTTESYCEAKRGCDFLPGWKCLGSAPTAPQPSFFPPPTSHGCSRNQPCQLPGFCCCEDRCGGPLKCKPKQACSLNGAGKCIN